LICESGCATLIIGDFNLPHINWKNLHASDDDIYLPMMNIFCEYGFTQYNDQPTRNHNKLDLVFCKNPHFITDITTEEAFAFSDHDKVCFSICLNVSPKQQCNDSTYFYDFAKADYDQIALAFEKVYWSSFILFP
jgi:hypothetical protein